MSDKLWPRVLLIGKNGQTGWELHRCLLTLGEIIAIDYPEIDLARPDNIICWVKKTKPNLIINAAACTAVDQAEDEPDLAMAINRTAPEILAEEAKKIDGKKQTPYPEEDETNPLNVYWKTKLAGERAIQAAGGPHFILRTS